MKRRGALTALLALLAACSDSGAQDSGTQDGGTQGNADEIGAPSASVTASSSASAPTASASASVPKRPPPKDLWDDKVKWDGSLPEQNAYMFDQLEYHHALSATQRKRLEKIFEDSEVVGQGNPAAAKHAASVKACHSKLDSEQVKYEQASFTEICGGKYMAPLYDPDKEKPENAQTCIDQFEFPNIPCSYPVTWVRANEAVEICQAMGKRLCDAHEWEGACWGKLKPPDYNFGIPKRFPKVDEARKRMKVQHNINIDDEKRWAYGDKYEKGACATSSRKSKDCGQGWRKCGSNTFPAGFFPGCVSRLGVYDIHGNAAEHMNLPLKPDQMASSPDQHYGYTEMKGSWFIFDTIYAHKDHCRWRAPDWHVTKVMNEKSHRNYHLGFRCCKSLAMQ